MLLCLYKIIILSINLLLSILVLYLLGYFLDIIHVGRFRRHPKLIIDDYEYQIYDKSIQKTGWRCRYFRKHKCKAKLFTTGKTVRVYNDHNHPPDNVDYNHLVKTKVTIIRGRF